MAIVEGPFQRITGITAGRSQIMVSCTISDINFVRHIDEEGVEQDIALPDQYRFREAQKPGGTNLPQQGDAVAFPIEGKSSFQAEISPGFFESLRKVGFAAFSPDGLGPALLYNAQEIFYVGRFNFVQGLFCYVVIGGLDAGLYVAQLGSGGVVQVLSYAPYLDLTVESDVFTPAVDAAAAEVTVSDNVTAVYMSDPAFNPAKIRFGIGKFVSIVGNRVAVAPRTVEISEVTDDGIKKSRFTPYFALSTSLSVIDVNIDTTIPEEAVERSSVIPYTSNNGYLRIPDSSNFISDNGDLMFSPSGQYLGLYEAAYPDFDYEYEERTVIRLNARRVSMSFGSVTVYRGFSLIDFVSQNEYTNTGEYDSLESSNAVTRVIVNDRERVMLQTASIFYVTDRSTVLTGDYRNE
jgi:hypothetical protein